MICGMHREDEGAAETGCRGTRPPEISRTSLAVEIFFVQVAPSNQKCGCVVQRPLDRHLDQGGALVPVRPQVVHEVRRVAEPVLSSRSSVCVAEVPRRRAVADDLGPEGAEDLEPLRQLAPPPPSRRAWSARCAYSRGARARGQPPRSRGPARGVARPPGRARRRWRVTPWRSRRSRISGTATFAPYVPCDRTPGLFALAGSSPIHTSSASKSNVNAAAPPHAIRPHRFPLP